MTCFAAIISDWAHPTLVAGWHDPCRPMAAAQALRAARGTAGDAACGVAGSPAAGVLA